MLYRKLNLRSGPVRRGLATTLGLTCALALAACGGSSGGTSGTGSATLQVWLGGTLTTSTPGSPYRTWVNTVIANFKKQHPHDSVDITLLPANNDQLAAKVESAFASHSVPDVMLLYTGAYTTVYQQGLMHLNSYVDKTPGFYNSISGWNLSCAGLDCKNGSGSILGVPQDIEAFFLFYNKKLFAEAGLNGPPTTWANLISDCAKLKAKHIVPMTYGDLEGYTTVNYWDENLASYINQTQMLALLAGHLKLTSPPFISALNAVEQLRTSGCAQSNASTEDQNAAFGAFSAGKTGMVEMAPSLLSQFEHGVGASNLGVTAIPGTGPLGTHVASNSNDNWVIPAQAKNPALAWDFIKDATNPAMGGLWAKDVGSPPANIAAASQIADPLLSYMAKQIDNPNNIYETDSVIPNGVALYLYKELNQFFAGQISAQQVMNATEGQLSSALASSSG
ncbi:MAG TPA: extracellular solute-binding protein [Streptosporangiaceae bacterium]|nr:extracellular solute-binding protein [Streptosporangiaceae bacterium]